MWEYNYANQNNELYHYGIPGMKWGKRKSVMSVGSKIGQHLKSKYALDSDPRKELSNVNGPTPTKKYALNKDKKKELAEVEGDSSKMERNINRNAKVGYAAAGTAVAVLGAASLIKLKQTGKIGSGKKISEDVIDQLYNWDIAAVQRRYGI